MAARNDGKKLEELVKLVESIDLPPGFKVETNTPVYDDDNNQIAELDILITGKVGTVNYRTLYECRDRPSGGAADGAWIQQLIGRRDVLGLTSVVAVSTTGFSPSAEKFAKDRNIELRTVDTLTEADIRGKLPQVLPIIVLVADAISFHTVVEKLVPKGEGRPPQQTYNPVAGKCIVDTRDDSRIGLVDLWNHLINSTTKFFDDENIVLDGPPIEKTIEFGPEDLSCFRLIHNDDTVEISKLAVLAKFEKYRKPMPMTSIKHYHDDGSNRHVVIEWIAEPDFGPIRLQMVAKVEDKPAT